MFAARTVTTFIASKLVKEGNDLCLQCHQAEVYDSYDHHFHKREHEGKPSDGYLCVKCHMAEQPYMVVDWRADHSLRVPRPDLTLETGTPNACSQARCHNDKPDSGRRITTRSGTARPRNLITERSSRRAANAFPRPEAN